MQYTPDSVKNVFSGKRCFNKLTGKIGYLAAEKIKSAVGKLYAFNAETGKLNSGGKRVTVEEMWNIQDVTIMAGDK
jgi:hypothetical protein